MISFLPPDVPLVRPPAAADPFRRAFVLLYRAVPRYAARGDIDPPLGEAQRDSIHRLRSALDEAKTAYQQHEPEPNLSDEQPGAREAVELLTALERIALDLPDAGNALDWLYTVDGDRFRAHLFANILKLSRTGWPSLPLFTTAPANYDFGFTETVREFDLPAVGGRPAQHWRELRIVAPDAADLTRLRSHQWNRYSSGGIYGTSIEDPTAENMRQRKWIDEQEGFSRGVIEGRAWLADPERTADEIRKRWEHFHGLRMTKSTGSYPREDSETRSQVDSPYYNALKTAEQRDAARAASNLAAARSALLSRGGALRPLYQVEPRLAEDLANRAALGRFSLAELSRLEGRIVPITEERITRDGRWTKVTEDELLVRTPQSGSAWYYFGAWRRDDAHDLAGDEGARLWKTGKPWDPPAYQETSGELNARLNRELPADVRRALRSHMLGGYEAGRDSKTVDWSEAKLTQVGDTWGVEKGYGGGWFVVDEHGHKLPASSKKYQAFMQVASPEKLAAAAGEAAWSKKLSAAFDAAAKAAGAEPGKRFRLDLRGQGFIIAGYGARSYMKEPDNRWGKPEKQPDTITYLTTGRDGLVWETYTRAGPKSAWIAAQRGGHSLDYTPLRKFGIDHNPLGRLKYDDPLRKRAQAATREVLAPLYAWVEKDVWAHTNEEAIAGWLESHPDVIERHRATMTQIHAERVVQESA